MPYPPYLRLVLSAAFLAAMLPPAAAQCPPGYECVNGQCSPSGWQAPTRITLPVAPRRSQQAHPAVFRVVIHDTSRSFSLQTGFLARVFEGDNLAYVATTAHGFTSDSRRIVVYTPAGESFEAVAQEIDHVWDVAILAIRKPSARPLVFARQRPVLRQVLNIGGFVGGKVLKWGRGLVTGWAGPVGDYPMEWFVIGTSAESGQSGGPILDSAGCLVGMICHGDDDTSGVGYWRIEAAIEAAMNDDVQAEVATAAPLPEPPGDEAEAPTPSGSGELAELRKLIEQNAKAIAILSGCVAVPGPDGKPGARGETGLRGERGQPGADGVSPTIDMDQLVAEVIKRLPPIYVRHVDAVTKTETIEEISLGQGFTIFNSKPQ